MRNVSFDNPLLLLIAVPLLLAVILPYVWAIRKENRNKAVVATLVLHILIIVAIALAAAGTMVTTYMTKTEVIFVADVSYSAQKNLDLVDEHIKSVSKKLPRNSKAALVCFGKDYVLSADIGEKLPSVQQAVSQVDGSATDIAAALNYASTLFSNDSIKHVVLLTDGRETGAEATTKLIQAIESLYFANINIDAIFVDNNISDGEKEVQVSGVEAAGSTYLNHASSATVMLQTASSMHAKVTLYKNGQLYDEILATLDNGYTLLNFNLDTSVAGTFDYEVRVEAEGDLSQHNNTYGFTQTVASNMQVLLISSRQEDLQTLQGFYGDTAQIDAYINDPKVPFTVEAMSKYDQIVVSSVDISSLENADAFVDSLDKAVSVFGKSLINLGDGKIQDHMDEVQNTYEEMLPLRYGNVNRDKKLYILVLDTSRSMNSASKMHNAKQVAIKLLNLLNEDDQVMVIGFSGRPSLIVDLQEASNKAALVKTINSIECTQGTVLGAAMREAYNRIGGLEIENKQVVLISDGLTYDSEADDPIEITEKMQQDGTVVSTVHIGQTEAAGVELMRTIAATGKGKAHNVANLADIESVVYGDIQMDLNETVVNKDTKVIVKNPQSPVMKGITALPNIGGFIQCRAKTDANTVLAVPYQKSTGAVVEVPLYAHWNYGNGKVACFTSDMLGSWSAQWQVEGGQQFFSNVGHTMMPEERVDYPYIINVEYDGIRSTVEVVPAIIDPFATMQLKITMPGDKQVEQTLYFDQTRYYYTFETPDVGKYEVQITYQTKDNSYVSQSAFHLARSPEYDAFAMCSAASLNGAIRDRGRVFEDGSLVIEHNKDEISTYVVNFTVPLLVAAVVMYVVDIIIRKLKWADIVSLFKKTSV